MRHCRNGMAFWISTYTIFVLPAGAVAQGPKPQQSTATVAAPPAQQSATTSAAKTAAAKAPTFTSTSTATFTVGKSATFSVTASGNPKPTIEQTPPSSDLTSLGLKFDPKTGKLTGSAKSAGTYTIKFEAKNDSGT